MGYCFDKVIDRRGSGAIMTDCLQARYGREDLLALWIADMYFETPDAIRAALEKRLDHQVYGYAIAPESYWQSILDWERRIHGWEIPRDQLTFIPGIVRGIAFVLQCFTQPGDKVVVQPPVYMPFLNLPRANGRQLVYNPLRIDRMTGGYSMDLAGLDRVCREEKPKVLILSNPHNPAGVVWPEEDLARLAEICRRHGVLVISDEIHADMVLSGSTHHPFPTVSATAADISITFAAPSKTFNMAGIVSSFCVVPNPEIREKFFGYLEANELNAPMFLSTVATEAAFTQCDAWRREMLSYVEANVDFVCDYLQERIPGIVAVRPQASFLIWLDCRGLGLGHDALIDLFVNRARLALNDGEAFGPGGEGHMRLNVGAPRSRLSEAMARLEQAVKSLK
ncbi:MAG: pyridoxal phosphate-dependent aminotransferase [Bacteroidales bacterium]|nr:pyridoxal phosphate-dependent aminotransferase [Bacteroidales bacterium]